MSFEEVSSQRIMIDKANVCGWHECHIIRIDGLGRCGAQKQDPEWMTWVISGERSTVGKVPKDALVVDETDSAHA